MNPSRNSQAQKQIPRSEKPTGAQKARFARNDKQEKASAEAAGDVGLRARITGSREELRRGTELDELASEQESGKVTDAGGLLHIVSDDGDRADVFQLHEQLFNFCGADGIERGAGLVEEQNFRLDGKSAGDAQTLLLAAGKFVSGLVEVVLHFVPERGVAQAFFDGVGDGKLRAVDLQAVGHVVENGLGERIGALEDHTNAAAKSSNVLREDALAVEKDFAAEARAADGFVHAVEGTKKSGFAAAGRADERGDLVDGDAHADIEKGLLAAIKEIKLGNGHAHGERSEERRVGKRVEM